MWYPKELFSIREDITRENIRRYEKEQKRIQDECFKRYPNYINMSCRERIAIREEIKKSFYEK